MEIRATTRKFYKELRNEMSIEECRQRSKQICDCVLSSSWYQKAQIILGYYPLENEVDILPVLEHALVRGKKVALPRTEKKCKMDFFEVKNLAADVTEGAFHIFEPKEWCERITLLESKKENVIALVPGVVFDKEGNRYGYGRGYYDRYFARCHDIYRVGIAYDMQLSREMLNAYPTDVKMHCIVTEKEEIKA